MKDLELRGTGNLLGDEQSGHIEGVGFDLYVRMVSEAVEQYKEPERKESVAVTIDLADSRRPIPVDYIDSDKLRLEAYQKLASARTEDDLDELRDELTDRYGKRPSISRRCSTWRGCGSRRVSSAFPRSSRKDATCACRSSSRVNPCRCAWPGSRMRTFAHHRCSSVPIRCCASA